MLPSHARGRLVIALLALAGLVLASCPPAQAETSYHKLKKRLRKLERATGQVLQVAGGCAVVVLGAVAEGMLADNSADDGEDCLPPSRAMGHPTCATPPVATSPPSSPRPATKATTLSKPTKPSWSSNSTH